MKIGNVDVKVSIVAVAVFIFFTIFLLYASMYSPEVRSQLIWMIPALFMLLVIPMALNYMSRSQYNNLEPIYEAEAKHGPDQVDQREHGGKTCPYPGGCGKGVFPVPEPSPVSRCRPFRAISVKMFTSTNEDIKVNDVVEVIGQVIKRYIVTGDRSSTASLLKKLKNPDLFRNSS